MADRARRSPRTTNDCVRAVGACYGVEPSASVARSEPARIGRDGAATLVVCLRPGEGPRYPQAISSMRCRAKDRRWRQAISPVSSATATISCWLTVTSTRWPTNLGFSE